MRREEGGGSQEAGVRSQDLHRSVDFLFFIFNYKINFCPFPYRYCPEEPGAAQFSEDKSSCKWEGHLSFIKYKTGRDPGYGE
jgi:hypothetical protein